MKIFAVIIILIVLILFTFGEVKLTFAHDVFYETTVTIGHWRFKKETKCLLPPIDWKGVTPLDEK